MPEPGKEGKEGKVFSLILGEQSNFREWFFRDYSSRRPVVAKTFPTFPSFPPGGKLGRDGLGRAAGLSGARAVSGAVRLRGRPQPPQLCNAVRPVRTIGRGCRQAAGVGRGRVTVPSIAACGFREPLRRLVRAKAALRSDDPHAKFLGRAGGSALKVSGVTVAARALGQCGRNSDGRSALAWMESKYERRFVSHHVRHSVSGGSGDNGGPNTGSSQGPHGDGVKHCSPLQSGLGGCRQRKARHSGGRAIRK